MIRLGAAWFIGPSEGRHGAGEASSCGAAASRKCLSAFQRLDRSPWPVGSSANPKNGPGGPSLGPWVLLFRKWRFIYMVLKLDGNQRESLYNLVLTDLSGMGDVTLHLDAGR